MIKHLQHLFLISVTSILLAGCGFAPHSVDSFPPELKLAYYQSSQPYEPFEIDLRKRLKACGVILLPSPKKSAPIINIGSNYSHSTNAPASSTQARIYNLKYTAIISITDYHHQTLLASQTVSVARDVSLLPDEVFETTSQISIAKQEMVQELSTKVLNVLAAKKTAEALQKSRK